MAEASVLLFIKLFHGLVYPRSGMKSNERSPFNNLFLARKRRRKPKRSQASRRVCRDERSDQVPSIANHRNFHRVSPPAEIKQNASCRKDEQVVAP